MSKVITSVAGYNHHKESVKNMKTHDNVKNSKYFC